MGFAHTVSHSTVITFFPVCESCDRRAQIAGCGIGSRHRLSLGHALEQEAELVEDHLDRPLPQLAEDRGRIEALVHIALRKIRLACRRGLRHATTLLDVQL